MKLLLNERNLIIGIASSIEYGVWGNLPHNPDIKSWKIGEISYAMDDNFTVVDIGDQAIPTYVKELQYYYIDGEFRLADECPNEYKERIVTLEETTVEYNAELLYQICLLQLGISEDDL